ncbi:MAG TPA: glycosyltransferase, partial [Candidatus Tumulicola sp.]
MTSQANDSTRGRPAYLDFPGALAEALSDAVDPDFYEYVYGKLAPGTTAASHYATVGWREGRDPNPWFCTRAYVEAHPEIAESAIVPLFHFLQYGAAVRPAGTPCEHAEAYYRRPPAGDADAPPNAGAGSELVGPGSSLADQWQLVRDAFDSEYYLAENPGVARAGIDPVLHFLQQGWTEGRDPNAWFSVSAYLDAYPDVAQTRLNPFYHFLATGRAHGREAKLGHDKFDANYYVETNPDVARMPVNPLSHFVARGWREGRAPNAWARANFLQNDVASGRREFCDGSNYENVLGALGNAGTVSIVVVLHDDLDEVRACVESIWRNTTYPAELLLIDDASTDPETARLLARWKAVSNVRVVRNATKRGYAQSIERGIRESRGDAVLLTGGTTVSPRWLENLVFAANQRPTIGTATPLTNGAGAFAIVAGDRSGAPISRDAAARLVMQRSRRCFAPTPIGNGLCTFVKRETLDRIGFLDVASAAVERAGIDDFFARTSDAGWEHVVDDATVVFGAGAPPPAEPYEPELQAQVQRFVNGPRLKAIKQSAVDDVPIGLSRAGASGAAPRVLYVVHGWGLGGTVEFCLDLIRGIGKAIEAYVLSSSGDRL